jgi:hypothetical protein
LKEREANLKEIREEIAADRLKEREANLKEMQEAVMAAVTAAMKADIN